MTKALLLKVKTNLKCSEIKWVSTERFCAPAHRLFLFLFLFDPPNFSLKSFKSLTSVFISLTSVPYMLQILVGFIANFNVFSFIWTPLILLLLRKNNETLFTWLEYTSRFSEYCCWYPLKGGGWYAPRSPWEGGRLGPWAGIASLFVISFSL